MKVRYFAIVALIFCLPVLILPQPSFGDPGTIIDEFHVVSPGIYRGAVPGANGLQALAKFGVKTIINLKTNFFGDDERPIAESLGMRYVAKPMVPFLSPRDRDIAEILNILADRAQHPVFVHCRHGQDRTGLVIGLYRVFVENWSATAAYDEMLRYGFHPELSELQDYFEEKTDWSPKGELFYELVVL
ncbi:MAG TPA: tyrosine-protein phosphatase [Bdellovibrionota bacterium]|nr:tyrosine-protein phosphatase [Bdellovibrionota bacterium]